MNFIAVLRAGIDKGT